MRTFLFRLCGPMQSWGTQSRFLVRDTGLEPSKSGVVGLICAAMGIPRSDRATIAKLAALKMAVRADRPGIMRLDYHTALNVIHADGSGRRTVESRRYYLADAAFLVGIEGAEAMLDEIAGALSASRWQTFLGRKSFVPSAPLLLPPAAPWNGGYSEDALEPAIKDYPWLGLLFDVRAHQDELRVVIDDPSGSEVRDDYPLSFDPRAFSTRRVRTLSIPRPRIRSQ
jgi:CRISPR system Cascade subunit CasD